MSRRKTCDRARGVMLPRAHQTFALDDREICIEVLPKEVRTGARIPFETHDA